MNPDKTLKPRWLDTGESWSLLRKLQTLRNALPSSPFRARPRVDPAELEAEDYLDRSDYEKLIEVLEWLESPRDRGRYPKGFKLPQPLPGLFPTDRQQFEALMASGMTEKEAYKELEKQWSVTERSVKRRINKAT